jgi:hypothetical protein
LIRSLTAMGIALLALISFGLYNGVHLVKVQQKELETLKASIAREGEAIRVLKAEWSYLNQPDRLQQLARRHLALSPTGPSQIVILASLPLKPQSATPATPRVVQATDLPPRLVPNAPLPRPKPKLGGVTQ